VTTPTRTNRATPEPPARHSVAPDETSLQLRFGEATPLTGLDGLPEDSILRTFLSLIHIWGGSMEHFDGRIAVVTGGGTGMGRELVRHLAAEGCHVATCDVADDPMAETRELALQGAPSGTRVTTFVADV